VTPHRLRHRAELVQPVSRGPLQDHDGLPRACGVKSLRKPICTGSNRIHIRCCAWIDPHLDHPKYRPVGELCSHPSNRPARDFRPEWTYH